MASRIGGSFAPPLTDELLDEYEERIKGLSSRLPHKDVLQSMLDCCRHWWILPESNGTATRPHPTNIPGRTATIVDLHPNVQKALWDHIPWDHEIEAFQKLCDGLSTGLSETEGEEKEVTYLDHETGEMQKASVMIPKVVDPDAKALRDMAFHLLWHVIELSKDREPLTADKVAQ